MNKIARKKLDDFAKRQHLTADQKGRLAVAMKGASAAQAQVILSQAAVILRTHKLLVRPAPATSPILAADGKPQEAVTAE